jgi:predicted DNA-binding transcriptional regulator YafY
MAAGVPLWTERGREGGVRLMEGWRSRVGALSATEVGALALSGAPQALSDLELATVAVTARAKLDAGLPPELRARAARVRERFLLDAPSWFARSEETPCLRVIADAVWAGRRLDLRYGPRGARRRVDPLGLVLKAGTWYLLARHIGELRVYRVSRVRAARPRDERCARDEGFDLASAWAEQAAVFERSMLRYPCRLRLSPHALRLLPYAVPHDAVRAWIEAASSPDGDGWRTVHAQLESEEVALDQLAALADGVEVIEPLSLRRALRERAARTAALNAFTPPAPASPPRARDARRRSTGAHPAPRRGSA